MKIKKYLKFNNQLILFLLCLSVFALLASYAKAGDIEYTPNIGIPGSSLFGGGKITITPNTFAEYIKAIYRYAGIMAGAFAMFMLVYGAWQWLMAAGNSSKIAMAKETVSTTLIGLAFLFGGYLLLSQISVNLVNLKPLVIKTPAMNENPNILCAQKAVNYPCGRPFEFEYTTPGTQTTSTIKCPLGYKCDEGRTCQTQYTEGGTTIWVNCAQNLSDCICRTGEAGEIGHYGTHY